MKRIELVPKAIYTIDDFFTADECADYMALSEGQGFSAATISTSFGPQMRTDLRDNSRLVLDDPALAVRLWERVQEFVPSPLWNRPAIGLNERLRFYRYDSGQRFKLHYDGAFTRPNGEKSQMTFMVYLNDDFEGGQTRFDLARSEAGEVCVQPKTGMAILFRHNLLHEGMPVQNGHKYLLRSDIMYGPPSEG